MKNKYLNLTLGPVMTFESTRLANSINIPYFRNKEFSKLMLDNQIKLLSLAKASHDSNVVFLTGSGSLAMQSAVDNFVTEDSKVLVINKGTFGQRFENLVSKRTKHCLSYNNEYDEQIQTDKVIELIETNHIEIVFTQYCESSTGLKVQLKDLAAYCKANKVLLVVDAISAFLADPIDESMYDVLLLSSQKALALQPGMSFVILNSFAKSKINTKSVPDYYNYSIYLDNMERGQTPYTPNVLLCYSLNERLTKLVDSLNGKNERNRISSLAKTFRQSNLVKEGKIKLYLNEQDMSDCCTAFAIKDVTDSSDFCAKFYDRTNIQLCPTGLPFKYLIRIGHLGNISNNDMLYVISELEKELSNETRS